MTEYTLRTLSAQDVFPMMRIISKIGIREFKDAFSSDCVKALVASGDDKDKIVSAAGMSVALDLAGVVFSHLPDAEKDIYSFLSGVSGMSEKQIKELDMGTFLQMIVDIIKKDEFKDFFKVASGLFKSEI